MSLKSQSEAGIDSNRDGEKCRFNRVIQTVKTNKNSTKLYKSLVPKLSMSWGP